MDERGAPWAPGRLERVRSFVNTRDVEDGVDRFSTSRGLDAWAQEEGLRRISAAPGDLGAIVELREALRAVLLSHHQGAKATALDAPTREVIDRAVEWGQVRPVLSGPALAWSTTARGTAGMVGRLLCIVAEATADGTWSRVKACHNDACQWAFYDHSRSRTGRWCSMRVCGNRNKQQRFHGKHPAG